MRSGRLSARKKQSLETMDEYERHDAVNTPRSLEACYREGIDPHELLYRPPEDFSEAGLSPRIQQLNFQLFEGKRQESLALARKTRSAIIQGLERSQTKSLGDMKPSTIGSSQNLAEKIHEKKVRAMRELAEYESKVTETLLARQEEERKRNLSEVSRQKLMHHFTKEKIAERVSFTQVQEEEKAEKESLRRERKLRKEAIKTFRQHEKEEEIRQKREAEEAKERALMIQQSEERLREKVQKAQENFFKEKWMLEQRLLQEEAVDEERKKAIEKRKEELRRKLQMRAKTVERKKRRAEKAFQKQLEQVPTMQKREEFYRKKSQEDRKSARFQQEQQLAVSRLHQMSVFKDEKSTKILETAAKIEEEKRNKFLQKIESIDEKVKRQKKVLEEQLEFKRHLNMLKELKKEWNVRRKQRKEEYLKAVSEQRLKLEDAKMREQLSTRALFQRSRVDHYRTLDLQQYRLKEALHSMAVTKKWSPQVIDHLAGGSIEVTTRSSRHTNRPRTAA